MIREINIMTGEVVTRDYTTEELTAIAAQQPTQAELIADVLSSAKAQSLPIRNLLSDLQSSAMFNGDTATAGAIETAKQGLTAITAMDLTVYTTKAEMEQAVYAAYLTLAAAAPPSVQIAFQSLVP